MERDKVKLASIDGKTILTDSEIAYAEMLKLEQKCQISELDSVKDSIENNGIRFIFSPIGDFVCIRDQHGYVAYLFAHDHDGMIHIQQFRLEEAVSRAREFEKRESGALYDYYNFDE